MDLRKLELFVATVEEGGMTRAAAAAHVSQPALSQAVRALEAELGIALFDRVGRGVRLTAAGNALLEPARQALRDVRNAVAAVDAVRGLEGGHLTVGSLRTLAADPTAPLIGAMRDAHPGVTVRLADPDDPDELLDMVRSGDVEIAITERPRDGRGLIVHRLTEQEIVVIFPPSESRTGDSVELEELGGHPLVATPVGTSTRRLLDDAFERAGVTPTIAVETGQRDAIVPLVLAGAGASLVPRPVAANAVASGARAQACVPAVTRSLVLARRDGSSSPAADRFEALALARRA